MNGLDKAYTEGLAEVLNEAGLSKKASTDAADAIAQLEKKAAMFNFSDSPYSDGISLKSVIVPLLASALTGYVAYNAGIEGRNDRSFLDNTKNFIGRKLSRFTRNDKNLPFYNINRYIDG